MEPPLNEDSWVYAVVQEPGPNEAFLGQQFEDSDIAYLPIFIHKEDGLACLPRLTRDPEKKYEVQAVIFADLCRQAAGHGYLLFALNAAGEIMEKIDPSTACS